MINFNCNNFSLLSEEVSLAMQNSIKECEQHRNPSFGIDQYVKAEIEKARYQIAGLMKANPQMLFFDSSGTISDINFILSLIFVLDVKLIVTSNAENKDKIEFLNQLCSNGKIRLELIDDNKIGRFDINRLSGIVNSNNLKKLITFSHANRITGELLPVKEIVSVCNNENTFFHLNTNLTIGKYLIDFEKLSPDFMSFSCNLMHGPTGIEAVILNPSQKFRTEHFNLLYQYLALSENKNPALISGLSKSISVAYKNIVSYQNKLSELKKYLNNKLKSISNIKILSLWNDKKGLLNLVPILVDNSKFGKYLKENFDLRGIAIDSVIIFSEGLNKREESIIPLSLNEDILESDIDYFIECLDFISENKLKTINNNFSI